MSERPFPWLGCKPLCPTAEWSAWIPETCAQGTQQVRTRAMTTRDTRECIVPELSQVRACRPATSCHCYNKCTCDPDGECRCSGDGVIGTTFGTRLWLPCEVAASQLDTQMDFRVRRTGWTYRGKCCEFGSKEHKGGGQWHPWIEARPQMGKLDETKNRWPRMRTGGDLLSDRLITRPRCSAAARDATCATCYPGDPRPETALAAERDTEQSGS
jgi:hypothetical protein